MIIKHNKQKGFTLLETLMAISIISITITGPLAIAAHATKLISVAKNQLVATFLAQEAIEMVRREKDSNMIKIRDEERVGWGPDNYDWLRGEIIDHAVPSYGGGLTGCIFEISKGKDKSQCLADYDLEPLKTNFYSCDLGSYDCTPAGDSSTAIRMVFKEGTGYYYNSGGLLAGETRTTFRRFILIEPVLTTIDVLDPDTGLMVPTPNQEVIAKVTVVTKWRDTYGEKSLTISENIYKTI